MNLSDFDGDRKKHERELEISNFLGVKGFDLM
jgi:hypothetical protein